MAYFADTNVCSKWESDPGIQESWQAAKAWLESQGHEYVACPLVLIELLSRLARPEPQYFSKDVKSFLFLASEKNRFLPFPGAFVLKTVLGVQSPVTALHPSDFEQMLRCVLSSDSRKALGEAEVEFPGSMLVTYGLDFAKVKGPNEIGRSTHVSMMEGWRKSNRIPTKRQHANNFLLSQGILPKDGEVDAVAEALDAAYQYQTFLLTGIDPQYDYAKHASDWVDRQLLYYLADPSIHIVTNDKNVKYRCRKSEQSNRVHVI